MLDYTLGLLSDLWPQLQERIVSNSLLKPRAVPLQGFTGAGFNFEAGRRVKSSWSIFEKLYFLYILFSG